MQRSSDTKTGNQLLDSLPPESLERLRRHLEPIELVVADAVDPTEHVCFPVTGMISVVAGMYSVSAILSDDSPFQNAMVQLPGRGFRLRTHLLRQEMQADEALQKRLLRYIQATLNAVAQSAACNRLHLLEQRCARWLLACHDRAESDRFPMTHEFLAMMLGVRRPGVTLALNSIREKALITYNHGTMTVIDREGLEAASCECHRVIRDEFARL